MFRNLTNRHPLLPALLLLVAVFLLLLISFGLAANSLPEPPIPPTPLPITPSLFPTVGATGTPTPTPTETPTPRPTWTLAPTASSTATATPTVTATPTLFPTLTPARPLQFNDLYRLRSWTPDRASHLITLMRQYPNVRFPNQLERQDPAFDRLYYYPAFALQEALLRFPDDPAAETWRWELGYALSHLNDPLTGEHYARLMVDSLNAGQVNIDRLPAWFDDHEERMVLSIAEVQAPPGYTRSFVMGVEGGGGAYIWLLEEGEEFEAQILESQFNFAGGIRSALLTGDLTGDGVAEAVITYSPPAGSYTLQEPRVYDLSQPQARRLEVQPSLPVNFGVDFQNDWYIIENPSTGNELQFIGSVFQSCPVRVTRSYTWNGDRLVFDQTHTNLNPVPEIIEQCQYVITHSMSTWDPEWTAGILQTLLPLWPPPNDPQGRPYPLDARDEIRYQVGVYSALAGKPDQARASLNELIESPASSSSQWAAAAARFLSVYQNEEDLFEACAAAEPCDTRAALQQVVSQIPPTDYENATRHLQRFGVTLRSSGIFDFENDGKPERWLLVRPRPDSKLDLWILVRNTHLVQAVFVDVVDSDNVVIWYSEPVEDPPVFQIRRNEGFILRRVPESGEAYLTRTEVDFMPTTFTLDALERAQADLLSGADPALIRRQLEQTLEASRFNCLNYRICDRFYYVLGLSYELSGETLKAIDTYIHLWWNHRTSPFTTMARLKLEQIPYNSPTPTQPPSPTPYPAP